MSVFVLHNVPPTAKVTLTGRLDHSLMSHSDRLLKLGIKPANPGLHAGIKFSTSYLLNGSSFLQKASRNCHHLLFLALETSHSHMNQIMQHSIHCMANSLDPDQPASSEAG